MYKQSIKYNNNFDVIELIEQTHTNTVITKYDDNGNLIFRQFAPDNWVKHIFNELNLVVYTEYSSGNWFKYGYTRKYNGDYVITEKLYKDGREYQYDTFGNVLSYKIPYVEGNGIRDYRPHVSMINSEKLNNV